MFWSRKPLISNELHDWIVDNFDWVTQHRPEWHDSATLILPTREFFDAPGGDSHRTALHILGSITEQLGFDAPIDLQPLSVLPDELRHEYGKTAEVAGQYMHDGEARLITYDPTLMRQPMAFVNTLAHEVIHARLDAVVDDLPGGAAMHELATDLHAIIAGFGVIQIEASEALGWAGYMTQPSRAVALAMFLRFHDRDISEALPYLSRRTARWLSKAWAEDAPTTGP